MIAWPLTEVPLLGRPSPRFAPESVMRTLLLAASQVLGPTTASTPMPAADCSARTAFAVPRPKMPSTEIEAPRSLSLLCRVLTASPRSPWRSFGWDDGLDGLDGLDGCEGADGADPPIRVPLLSAAQVLGPTTASTPMP